ncbi:MAG: hypothetical protein J1F07_09845 [Muribaculaceae bacterium]|nr:hypothetical protein [Muribaculaceae bacterium]
MSDFQLKYSGDEDRAFGLAGMAISMASLDALDRITEIFLDADGPMVNFANSYYFSWAPSVSPKVVWENLMTNFQLTTSLVMGNVMARSLVRLGREARADVLNEVRALVREEGREVCSLDEEEADALFDRVVDHSRRLFHNPRLHPAVSRLAAVIAAKRRLSVIELAEELEMLRI